MLPRLSRVACDLCVPVQGNAGMVANLLRYHSQATPLPRILLDTLSMMQQLGVVPVAPEPGAHPNAAL
jgi:hypothetical protein